MGVEAPSHNPHTVSVTPPIRIHPRNNH